MAFKRIPTHIGIIPDGNRRWALSHNMPKQAGYSFGVEPGVKLCELMEEYGVKEVTFYGFTTDNTGRPREQSQAFSVACAAAVNAVSGKNANILVVGNVESKFFPEELKEYTTRKSFGSGVLNINFLINYDWSWDLGHLLKAPPMTPTHKNTLNGIASRDIPRMELIIRWGGRTRLSGFLPVQSVYSDFYTIDEYWPDFKKEHFISALQWYQDCDVTLGG